MIPILIPTLPFIWFFIILFRPPLKRITYMTMLVPGLDTTDVDVRLPPPHPRLRHCLPRQLHRHLLSRLQVYSSFPTVIPLPISTWMCHIRILFGAIV